MYQTSRRRKKKLSEEWVQWLLQCAMTSFPKSIQLTVHVLQSQQQVGPFWKCSAASTTAVFLLGKKKQQKTGSGCGGGWALLCNGISRHGQTQTLVSPSTGFTQSLFWGVVLTKRSQWREGMHMDVAWLDWWGPAGDGGYFWSPMPSLSLNQTGGLSQMSTNPLCETTTKAAFGKFRSLCDWMTKVERIINDSNLVLAFSHHISFIHTSYSDEQCITQKYKGKILVLHYTFSKIYTE